MDLREAQFIVNIYKHNGISNAAKELNISQSSLSRCLQSVESSLGDALFIRENGSYVPTYIGNQYIFYAKQLLDIQGEWDGTCNKLKNKIYGDINISLSNDLNKSIFAKIVTDFKGRYPHVNINLHEIPSSPKNLNFDYDFTICTNNGSENTNDTLYRDEMILVAPRGHKSKSLAFYCNTCSFPCLELEQLLNYSFIQFDTNTPAGEYMENYFLEKHISPSISFSTNSFDTAISTVLYGKSLCFLPKSYILSHPLKNEFDIYSFHQSKKTLSVIAIYDKSEKLNEYKQYFLELTQSSFQHI